MGGSAATAVLFQACGVPEDELFIESPVEMPEDMVTGLDNWYATLCRQCPTSEGIVVRVMEGRAKKIEGNIDHPINRGKHSARCEANLQALYHPDRISAPLVRLGERGEDKWEEISWTDAISRLANQLGQLQDRSTMVMVTDPIGSSLDTVVSKFVSAYGGRYAHYEPLERTALSASMKNVFGQNTMPDFDIEHANYIVSFGAEFLDTWMSPVRYALGYGQFRQGTRDRGTMVHIDPRFSMTGANADEWIYVKPGAEGLLALSMAQVIIEQGLGDSDAVEALTDGGSVDLSGFSPDRVTNDTGVPAEKISRLARDFASHRPALAIGGGSAAAHTNGSFNLQAIYSLNYLVGSVGSQGGVLFNPEPALNNNPNAPSITSFTQWNNLVNDMREGQIQALLIRGADPFYGAPSATGLVDASYNVPLLVSFAGHMNDTARMADLILPEHNPLEDWGNDQPNPGPGYQTVAFQQPVVRPFFEPRGTHLGTKGFADVVLTVAQVLNLNLGLSGDTFKEIVQASAKELFEQQRGTITASDFDSFWHGVLQRGAWSDPSAIYNGQSPKAPPLPNEAQPAHFDGPNSDNSFYLAPFASSSLTDGRGADLPWLQAMPDPITTATWRTWIEINDKKANDMDLKEGDVIKVESAHGSILALAYPHPGISPEVVAIPIGQGHIGGGRYSKNRGSNVLSILAPSTDTGSGAWAWAATRVTIEKTGDWIRLPRFENSAPDLAQDKGQRVVKITAIDT